MSARQKIESTATTTTRRQVMIGTGTLAVASMGIPPWALGQSARGYSAASFEPYVGQGFLVTGNNVNTVLRLIKVDTYPRGTRPLTLSAPFSLIFRDTGNTGGVPAEIVKIERTGVGQISVFLHPITKDKSYYEAAFN